jgi:Tol biopolymer transport system component
MDRNRFSVQFLLVVSGVMLAVGVAPAHAAFLGANGRIAFTSDRDGNREIYVMNADGTGQTRLTNDPASDSDPAWSPDGTKIAFVSSRDAGDFEIYKMNADGTGQTRLTNEQFLDADPAWSPDGTKIAFTSRRDGSNQIYLMNADGTSPLRLTNNGASEGFPAWSPDGSKIAFQTSRDGNWEIYKMNPDGTGQVNLTNAPASEDITPTWSPDGKEIGFATNRVPGDQHDIWKMNADGSSQVSVIALSSDEQFPAAAPGGGGNGLAMSNADGDNEIYSLIPNVPLTSNTADDSTPDWQAVQTPYVRPVGATPYRVPLVPAFNSCPTTNTTHAGPISIASCAVPLASSGFLTVGTPDANGATAKSIGFVRIDVFCNGGATGEMPPCSTTPGDQLDGKLTVSDKDVRCQGASGGCSGTLADYTGDLMLQVNAKISDRNSAGNLGATTLSYPVRASVPCTGTADTTVGSTCSLTSSLDAVIGAGAVVEQKRAIWELGQVQVLDGGSDGDATTLGDNTTFAVSGVFFP